MSKARKKHFELIGELIMSAYIKAHIEICWDLDHSRTGFFPPKKLWEHYDEIEIDPHPTVIKKLESFKVLGMPDDCNKITWIQAYLQKNGYNLSYIYLDDMKELVNISKRSVKMFVDEYPDWFFIFGKVIDDLNLDMLNIKPENIRLIYWLY
jgi:hypothetical protein